MKTATINYYNFNVRWRWPWLSGTMKRHYLKTLGEFLATAEKDEYGDLATYALEADREDIDKEFLRALLEEYLTILRKEEEYQLSDEVADEMIVANKYEFTEDGKIV
jgi:hypothetical protein